MASARISRFLPSLQSASLALISAILLILAFPGFEYWFLAWFSLFPLFWAIEKEREWLVAPFLVGWLFGVCFFFGSCWWLTYAPVTYAGFPPILAYFLLFLVTALVGLFTAIFAALLSIILKRFGPGAILTAPLVWVSTEFLRYWITGNNWNAIGYSQAFARSSILELASFGGVYLTGACVVFITACIYFVVTTREARVSKYLAAVLAILILAGLFLLDRTQEPGALPYGDNHVIAVQPNVPMDGLDNEKWERLRQKHVELSESGIRTLNQKAAANDQESATVIFPESPMNFMYEEDPEFQRFVSAFAARHNVNVLFNSAEPDPANRKYFNSAVLVDTNGRELVQYDKIYLMPFGEAVPWPLQSVVPAFVGSFSYGEEYALIPVGDAKAGVMICFESHFGELSREYVRRGADVIIEMTNDGYLGPTPVLRQHLANAVFRAAETNRPVLRVTNVGITAYISERGEVIDQAESYTEATRVWSVARSGGRRTFYVNYGDWFAWLCMIGTATLTLFALSGRFGKHRNRIKG